MVHDSMLHVRAEFEQQSFVQEGTKKATHPPRLLVSHNPAFCPATRATVDHASHVIVMEIELM